ncbi:MAG: hypothetical protein KJ970_05235 [Candidatus Eisenbacteria bacterium]|uniref:BON domain-containing protein n=1 Tax=Eiseniibacteriota bacterium TaxID=2212470 RepID=A0A948RVG8_UNCEI|nr:hypothetical protein [Candidatus Eisenbacteria bacterium]MBU1950916.1 hypothetical protein [Candidatus Eisenbacteria bacterium]MBU2690313.1 hypothetical protein [Candidatus Eisenbacteria bacterium]
MEDRDYQITARVRRVLSRRSIDPGPLEFGSVDGVVYLRGVVHRLPGSPAPVSKQKHLGSFLERLEEDLRRIEGVHSVAMEFQGYEKVGTEWKPATA